MNTSYLKQHFYILLSIWTLIVALFLVYDYKETKTAAKIVIQNKTLQQIEIDTTLDKWSANYQKRSLILFSTFWILDVIGIWIGF